MKKSEAQQQQDIIAGMTLANAECLVTEIADYTLTRDGLKAEVEQIFRHLDTEKARLAAEVEPVISRKNEALFAVEKSLEAKVELLEQWAEAHKGELFAAPRSLRLLRATIGFRQGQPSVTLAKGITAAVVALRLRCRKWGRAYLRPAQIDREAILRDEAIFLSLPKRLPAVGIVISRKDTFYIDVDQSGSDAVGREAA